MTLGLHACSLQPLQLHNRFQCLGLLPLAQKCTGAMGRPGTPAAGLTIPAFIAGEDSPVLAHSFTLNSERKFTCTPTSDLY
jgi:hypothetical protein